MGAELGATTSVFPFDDRMAAYLRPPAAPSLADLAVANRALLGADPEVLEAPERFYDEIVEIDLSALEPQIVGPHTPDLARPVSRLGADAQEQGYPVELRAALIGSCTNSSYEDISRAAAVARQGLAAGLKAQDPALHHAGSDQIYRTIERDGMLGDLPARSAAPCWPTPAVPASASGAAPMPCPGARTPSSRSFNRNFPRRNDGMAETLSFIASPEIVTALAFAGRLDFDPLNDALETAGGAPLRFSAPQGEELPARGFAAGDEGYVPPAADGRARRDRAGARQRAPPAARALPALGRQGLRGPAGPDQGAGQVHDRPHLPGGAVAALPRPPRQDQRQPVPRRHQRLLAASGAGGPTSSPGRRGSASRRSRAATRRRASARRSSATRTTARAAAASTRPCRRATSA